MPKYTMRVWGGATPSFGGGFVGAQGAALLVEIQKDGETGRTAIYGMFGVGGGVGFKGGVSVAQGPQSASEFDSPVLQADLFWGMVKIIEGAGIQLGVLNAGYSDMEWLDGPAKGTKCSGFGYGLCAGLSATGVSVSRALFKFGNWENVGPRKQIPSPVRAETDPKGRVLQQ
jgi:hypothetical protein